MYTSVNNYRIYEFSLISPAKLKKMAILINKKKRCWWSEKAGGPSQVYALQCLVRAILALSLPETGIKEYTGALEIVPIV